MINRYCARTLSENVTTGKLSRSLGVFEGEMLSPLPINAGTMMKYFEGLRAARELEKSLAQSRIADEGISEN